MAFPRSPAPQVQALILADQIYRDGQTGKFVIAGTFRRVEMPTYPATLNRIVSLFVSLRGLTGKGEMALAFVHQASGNALLRMRPFEVTGDESDGTLEFAIEIPPLPLPEEGWYRFELEWAGKILGGVSLLAWKTQTTGDPFALEG